MRDERQWEFRVTGDRMSGRVVACARNSLKKTNKVALGAKGRGRTLPETDLAKDSEKGPTRKEWQ